MSNSFAIPWAVPPGSSVHGIFQARILAWAAISYSRGSSHPRDGTQVPCRVSCIAGRFFTTTGEALTECSSLQLGILPAPTTTAPCSALSTLVIEKGLWFPMNPSCCSVLVCLCVWWYICLEFPSHFSSPGEYFSLFLYVYFFTEVPLVYNIM